MGQGFDCGCRCSMGHWFLCCKHETELLKKLESKMDKKELENSKANIKYHRGYKNWVFRKMFGIGYKDD